MIRKFLSPLVLFYVAMVLILLIGTYGQLFRNYANTPSGRYYYGGEEYPLDLTLNIAHVREGLEGYWRAFFNLTTQFPEKPSILKFEYILIGKIAKIFSWEPVFALHLMRFFISLFWFGFLYLLITNLFYKQWERIVAMLFVLFAASIHHGSTESFVNVGVFDAQVLVRFTYAMPHYLLGGLTAFIGMWCYAKAVDSSTHHGRWTVGGILFGMWSSLLYGPTAIVILGGIPLIVLFQFIRYTTGRIPKQNFSKALRISLLYAISLLIPILYVRFVVAVQWSEFNLNDFVEKLNPFKRTPLEYLYSLGFIYFLSIISLPQILKKKQIFFLLLYSWNYMHPLGMYVLADLADLNPIRFYLMPYYVAFGLLGIVGIQTVLQLIPTRARIVRFIIGIVLVLLVVLPSIPTLYLSWKRFELCYCVPEEFTYGYPNLDVMKGIWWLRDNTSNDEIVYSDFYAGTLIPPFAGNKVYTSWWYRLSGVESMKRSYDEMVIFFRGGFTDEDASNILKQYKISYLFYGPEERNHSPWKGEPLYPVLEEVIRFGSVVIYKVK